MESDVRNTLYPSFVEILTQPASLCGVGFFSPKYANKTKLLEVRPGIVYFQKFSSGSILQRNVKIYNISAMYLRVYVAFPETKWFSISTKKEHNLRPGLSFDINVTFKPDEDRYYYDTFKVYSQPCDVVFVQLHALPYSPIVDFPKNIKLPTTTIGEVSTKSFMIKCQSPIDLEFKMNLRPPNIAVCVSPIAGILSQIDEDMEITLTCQPKSSAAIATDLMLTVTNVSLEPYVCSISGEVTECSEVNEKPSLLADSKTADIYHRSRPCKRLKGQPLQIEDTKAEGTFGENVVTLADLCSPQAVARLLLQKPGKLKTTQVKKMAASNEKVPEAYSRQIKEVRFVDELKKAQEAERLSKLHWQTRLGAVAVGTEIKAEIIASRGSAWIDYTRGAQDDSMEWKHTELLRKCIVRELIDPGMLPTNTTFGLLDGNMWPSRLHALQRFMHAARKITIQNRAQKRLCKLQEWHKQKTSLTGCSFLREYMGPDSVKFEINIENIHACPQTIFWKKQDPNLLFGELARFAVFPLKCHLPAKITTVPERELSYADVMGYKPYDVYKAKYGCVAKGPAPWPEHKCPLQKMLEVDRDTTEESGSKALKVKIAIPSVIYQALGHNTSLIFNPRASVQTYLPLPPATELEQDYILYPLSSWRPKGHEKSHLDPDVRPPSVDW